MRLTASGLCGCRYEGQRRAIELAEDEMPRSDTRYVRTHTSSMLSQIGKSRDGYFGTDLIPSAVPTTGTRRRPHPQRR